MEQPMKSFLWDNQRNNSMEQPMKFMDQRINNWKEMRNIRY